MMAENSRADCEKHAGQSSSAFCMSCQRFSCSICAASEHDGHRVRPVDFLARCCRAHLQSVALNRPAWATDSPQLSIDMEPSVEVLSSEDASRSAAVEDVRELMSNVEAELQAVGPGSARESEGLRAAQTLYENLVAAARQRRDELMDRVKRESAAAAAALHSEIGSLREIASALETNSRLLLTAVTELTDTAVIAHVLAPSMLPAQQQQQPSGEHEDDSVSALLKEVRGRWAPLSPELVCIQHFDLLVLPPSCRVRCCGPGCRRSPTRRLKSPPRLAAAMGPSRSRRFLSISGTGALPPRPRQRVARSSGGTPLTPAQPCKTAMGSSTPLPAASGTRKRRTGTAR
jgi:hypothetical protein